MNIARTIKERFLLFWIGIFFSHSAWAQEEQTFTILNTDKNKPQLNDSIAIKNYLDSIFKTYGTEQQEALPHYHHALSASLLHNRFIDATDAFSAIITILNNQGMYENTIREVEDLEQIAPKYIPQLLPIVYNSKGNYYKTIGIIDSALLYYFKAIEIIDHDSSFNHPTALATIYTNLSGIYNHKENDKIKLSYLENAEEIARKSNHSNLLTLILINQSHLYIKFKEYTQAINKLNEALDIAQKKQFSQWQCLAYINLANLYVLQKDYLKAQAYLGKAEQFTQGINPIYRNQFLTTSGSVFLDLKAYHKAEYFLSEAVKHAQHHHLTEGEMSGYELLAKLYAETQQFEKAWAHHLKFTTLKDSLADIEVLKSIQQLELKHRVIEKDKQNALHQLKIKEQQILLQKRNNWIYGIGAGMVVLSILLINIYRTNRYKRNAQRKQIEFLQQEQETLKRQQQILQNEKEIDELKAMIHGEEKERKRLSQELHDGIGGMLSAINMNINAMQNKYPQINQIKDVNIISKMIEDTSKEVRKAAHNLMPDVLIRHGLREALVIYCDQINAANQNLQTDFQCHGDLEKLEKGSMLAIYRIIQELIQNVVKHAEATYAVVQIMQFENNLNIMVEDNGKGFEHHQKHIKGYGLQNLDYRVKALEGKLSIMSTIGKGTTVLIELKFQSLI